MRLVSQILQRKGNRVVSVDADAPVLEAIRLLAEHHIGAVLVMRDGELVGIASERDYARKVILQGRSSAETPVAGIMSSPVTCVDPQASVAGCMALMTERRIRHLPVVEDGQLVGVVSIGDLVKEVIADQEQEIVFLQQFIAS
jgi:CBS domain-containing protein